MSSISIAWRIVRDGACETARGDEVAMKSRSEE
jgi:hypothetical protein